MKNDIDSILESMFRGGRLHFKSSQPTETSGEDKVPSSQSKAVVSQAQANAQEAQRALDAVDSAGDQLSQSLQQSLERLTQEAKADMADLERHLRQDGVDTQTVARNAGDPVDLEMAFQVARQEAGVLVLGRRSSWTACSLPLSGPLWRAAGKGNPCAGHWCPDLMERAVTALCGVSLLPLGGRGCSKVPSPRFWTCPDTAVPGRKRCLFRTFTLP